MVFDFLKGQFVDVIHYVDDTRDTMVWRFERQGHAINYGAKLTVREGQAAVFIHEGQLADVFGPGLYMLETNNLPVLTALQHWDHGFRSPFKSEVYFINTTRFTGQKWGTRNPIITRDPEFGPIRLRAFGTFTLRVTDPGRFMTEIVGTDGEFTTEEISVHIRDVIVQEFSRVIASSNIPVLDMAANTKDLGTMVTKAIAPAIDRYGISLPDFFIENISLPEEVEKVLDKRTSMGIAGDLGRYAQLSAADAMTTAAATPGSAMGSGMVMVMGMGMPGPWGQAPSTAAPVAAPPPPPSEAVWHIAEAGQTKGPYNRAMLGQMMSSGQFTRNTLVWTPGQDGWKPAGDIAPLAQLFTMAPPPPPAL